MLKRVIAVMCAVATVIGSAVGLSNNKTEPETTFTAPAIEIAYYDNTYYLPYALSYNEWEEIYCVVMSEAEGEGFDGQMFVANCIINKCRLTGKTPHDVTKKGVQPPLQLLQRFGQEGCGCGVRWRTKTLGRFRNRFLRPEIWPQCLPRKSDLLLHRWQP